MRKILLLILPLLCILQSCVKPDEPDDISTVPVFTVDGTLNGAPVSMAAGENGMYMFTFAREEPDGTFAYGGRIAKENCENNCGPALEIFLIDTLPFILQNGESRVWEQLTGILFHGSVLNENVRCEMDLLNHSYSPYGGLEERWQFNDACTVHGKLKADYLYFPSTGAVKTTLMMKDSAGNEASIQKTLDYYKKEDSKLRLKVEHCTPGKARLTVDNPDQYNLTYKWDDQSYASYKCVNLEYTNVLHSVTVVADEIEYETVLSCTVKKDGSDISYLRADFGFDIIDHDFKMADAWPRVVIRYRDENGKWYDSRNIHQNDYCNYFTLTDVQSYHADYQGNNTKKAEAFFSVSLRDSLLQCIELEHFHVKFGFGSRE